MMDGEELERPHVHYILNVDEGFVFPRELHLGMMFVIRKGEYNNRIPRKYGRIGHKGGLCVQRKYSQVLDSFNFSGEPVPLVALELVFWFIVSQVEGIMISIAYGRS